MAAKAEGYKLDVRPYNTILGSNLPDDQEQGYVNTASLLSLIHI